MAAETGRCYREHLWGDLVDEGRKAVRMQLITTGEEMLGGLGIREVNKSLAAGFYFGLRWLVVIED